MYYPQGPIPPKLTENHSQWPNYGGQIDYVNNLLGSGHSQTEFYTNPTVVNAYKNYVSEIVTRYKDSPAIFAWELANEVSNMSRPFISPVYDLKR